MTTAHTPIETYRGFVYPWSIDHVGHLNVQSYVGRFDEASWHFLARLGLGPTFLAQQGRAVVAADQRIRYRREVLAGTLLHVTTELLAVGRSSVRFVHRMYDSERGEEVASMELVGVYFDSARRESAELPERVREGAAALLASPSAHDAPGAPEAS